ncbi:MAG: FkbM family methyltransferase [Microcystis aeruginosa K13-05]|jgi:FkbM family methyltransferase|uniref:FkbM family methyltransferase n=1 Tax=unclassified Microcystis TaxID=2643300 RepID=UPI0022C67D4E|nr:MULTISPECIES: FkbM family methyltransferase [unclassified Microcystis]MCZ8050209.1 FkbM family methyltransferase [Microcystis sp. LE19-41.2A]MCZ8287830.1 FkbM family methyltransferase [Microcystis sp. LE19-59.1C]NCR81896.1 FkbM family methyltransferase [Microcystis aeruginosa K13-10]NCR86568.1 FkbM family methyltransferase [Microcystis aeruginosa K13-05]
MSLIKTLSEQKYPVRFLLSRILMRTGLCKLFTVQRNGYKIRFNPSGISAQLWVDPGRMRWEERFLEDYLKLGDRVIDVGANIGTLSLRASTLVGAEGEVFSFEANPILCEFIKDNQTLNQFTNIKIYNLAVGDSSGTIYFALNKSDDRSRVHLSEQGIAVEKQPLDRVIPDVPIALLKIDVEGYEKWVFQGAEKTIQNSQVVMFESLPANTEHYQYSVRENFQFLLDRGFQIFKLGANKTMYSVDIDRLSQHNGDLFALRNVESFIARSGYRFPNAL